MRFNLQPLARKQDVTLIIDAKYLAYRTKYTPTFSLSYGNIRTGLAYGFLNTLRQLATKMMPVNTVLMWDTTPLSRSRRKREYLGYKCRDDISNLTEQDIKEKEEFQSAYQILMADMYLLGFAGYELDGYEADDLIALWCKRFTTGTNVIITRDEDMLQCINENTEIYNPDDKIYRDLEWFKKNFQLEPSEWALVKAIAGCKSDTVPGVPGVANAKAIQYLKGGGTPKLNEKVESFKKEIELYYTLVKLPHPSLENYFLPFKFSNLDLEAFVSYCQQNGFKSFIENLSDFKYFSKGEERW